MLEVVDFVYKPSTPDQSRRRVVLCRKTDKHFEGIDLTKLSDDEVKSFLDLREQAIGELRTLGMGEALNDDYHTFYEKWILSQSPDFSGFDDLTKEKIVATMKPFKDVFEVVKNRSYRRFSSEKMNVKSF